MWIGCWLGCVGRPSFDQPPTRPVGSGEWAWRDGDADGYGDPLDPTLWALQPPSGYVLNDLDCDDTRADVSPAADETCGVADEDCDGRLDGDDDSLVDEELPYWPDTDLDGLGTPGEPAGYACRPPDGFAGNDLDCDPTAVFGLDWVDGVDDDCDGVVDLQGLHLGTALRLPPPGPARIHDTVAADLDLDGQPELYLQVAPRSAGGPAPTPVVYRFGAVRLFPGGRLDPDPVIGGPWRTFVAGPDLDGDGMPSLIVSRDVDLLYTLEAPIDMTLLGWDDVVSDPATGPLGVADHDGDGFDEVVFFSETDLATELVETIRPTDGALVDWTWVESSATVLQGERYVGSADLDGDGVSDLVSGTGPLGFQVRLGGQGIPHRAPIPIPSLRVEPWAAGDVDGDGRDDLAACTEDDQLGVWSGATVASWDEAAPAVRLEGVGCFVPRWLRDLDGDGLDDLIVLQSTGLVVHRGEPGLAGSLRPADVDLVVPFEGMYGAVTDLDQDGDADLLLARDGELWALAGSP